MGEGSDVIQWNMYNAGGRIDGCSRARLSGEERISTTDAQQRHGTNVQLPKHHFHLVKTPGKNKRKNPVVKNSV